MKSWTGSAGYPLLVIDDFGMERGTEYALEQIYNIIDSRYRSRKPLIVTTNLTLTELKNPQDTAHARIYDRLLELCTPIACTGPSMRKDHRTGKIELAENTSGLNGRNAIERKRHNELAGAGPPDEEPGYPHDRTVMNCRNCRRMQWNTDCRRRKG